MAFMVRMTIGDKGWSSYAKPGGWMTSYDRATRYATEEEAEAVAAPLRRNCPGAVIDVVDTDVTPPPQLPVVGFG